MAEPDPASPEALIPRFVFERLLNQDNQGRRIILLGQIDSQPALLTAERAAFSTSSEHLSTFASSLQSIQNLGDNDIYRWYLARTLQTTDHPPPHDLKLNLIFPCTPKHIAKYTPQTPHYVTETPSIYSAKVRPWIAAQRAEGRLNWVFNILAGRTEQEDVVYRSWEHHPSEPEDERFLLLPDLNWDRRTLHALHLLCLPLRRDKWSVRDLRKADLPWLRGVRERLARAVGELYAVAEDGLKFYVHSQLDPTATQAVGKALDLNLVIAILDAMPGEDASMADIPLSYTVGEGTDLWKAVWGPLQAASGEK